MNDKIELRRKELEIIANESLEGMDEAGRKECETIQRLLKESEYGRKPAEIEHFLSKVLNPRDIMRDALRNAVAGNIYPHSESVDLYMKTANNLMYMANIYLGIFGRISVEPFPGGFRSESVKIQFRPK